MKNQQLKLN